MKRILLSFLALVAIGTGARAQDMTSTPLTLEATTAGVITFSLELGFGTDPSVMNAIEYQKNDGAWTTYTWGDAISVSTADKVAFRGNNATYNGNGTHECHITSTADVYVYGNIMSLINSTSFASLTTLTGNNTFSSLFKKPGATPYEYVANTTIKSHATNALLLPATTLTNYCYNGMFAGCQGLTRAPELPATEMTVACYAYMFEGCTGLTVAPALPTTTFTEYGFDPYTYEEFGSIDCYMSMFEGCTSLTSAPALPATTLVHGVYQSMFKGCTSLTTAPDLPAKKVADAAYYSMFNGCTSLNYVKCLATDFLINPDFGNTAEDNVKDWLKDVAATGTFVRASTLDWPTGESGIPTGWTVQNATAADGDMGMTPLTFEALNAGTQVSIKNPGGYTIEYKVNTGEWTSSSSNPITINLDAGDKAQFRGNNPTYCDDGSNMTQFSCDKDCYVYGNVMSLINATDYGTARTLNQSYTFSCLFVTGDWGTNTTIKNHSYKDLVLPATTLTNMCYNNMFYGCQGLTRAPILPATNLATYCYNDMFSGCSGLTEAPQLPATTLAEGCYTMMFYGCTSLTTAPDLPAPVLPMGCYDSMFGNCSSLSYVKCLATTIFGAATMNWLDGVSATGTFVKMSQMRDWPAGVNGIPTGWTVQAATEADGDYGAIALTLEAVVDGTITLSNPNSLMVNFSWYHGASSTESSSFSSTSKNFEVKAGDKILLNGNQNVWGNVSPGYGFHISSTNDIYVYGNVMSLVKSWDFANVTTLTGSGNFACLFGDDGSTNTTIKNHPTKDIVLGATTLTESCYAMMFAGCQGLTRAPELPATTLANTCYHRMFGNCTGLTTAPTLPAETLAEECYFAMFDGCSNLNYVKCLATSISATGCTDQWLNNVAAAGTFIMADGMTGWTTGVNGIPTGWTGAETTANIAANDDGTAMNYWATYYNAATGSTADDYTTVYTAKLNGDKSKAVLTEVVDKTIPAGNVVILKSANPTITMTYCGATGTLSDNELEGSATDIATPANTYMLVR